MVITREFDAPRELVFKAFVDPDLYVQWLGARGFSMSLGGAFILETTRFEALPERSTRMVTHSRIPPPIIWRMPVV